MANKAVRTTHLTTPFETDTQFSWRDYPRPQLKRDSYISLCGKWQFAVKKYEISIKKYSRFAGRWSEQETGNYTLTELGGYNSPISAGKPYFRH